MAYERLQHSMLPQAGFFVPQNRLNVIPHLASASGTYMQPNNYSRGLQFPMPLTGCADAALYDHNSNLPARHSLEKDYLIINYEELEKLLPDPKPVGRVELGILPNGCAYAPKTASRENYLLFFSKSSYILYFTHHYFSRENLSHDLTFLNMLINRLILPTEKLIKAPRLAALNTTIDEVEKALVHSRIVCIEDIDSSTRGVRRIDGYPALSTNSDVPQSCQINSSIPNNSDSVNNISLSWRQFASSDQRAKADEQADRSGTGSLCVGLNDLSIKAAMQICGDTDVHNVELRDEIGQANTGTSVSVSHNVPVAANQDFSKSGANISVTLPSCGMNMPLWNQRLPVKQFATPAQPGNSVRLSNLESGLSSFANYPSLIGLSSRIGLPNTSSIQPELHNVAILPIRPSAHLPQYFVGQTANLSGNYSNPVLYSQGSNNGQNFNLNMAAALATINASNCNINTQQNTPYHNNHFLTGSANQFNSVTLGQHQSTTALAPANQYHAAAIAALAAVAHQQNTNPSYIQAAINSPMHPQTHSLQPPPVHFPVYYATQHFPLQPVQRHSVQRLQNPVCPMQTYTYQPIPGMPCPEIPDALGKIDVGCNYSPGFTQATSNFGYPLLLPHMHIPPGKSTTLSNLATAAAGLQLHYSPQSTRPYSVTHIPVNVALLNSVSAAGNYSELNNPIKSLSAVSGMKMSRLLRTDDVSDASAEVFRASGFPSVENKCTSTSSASLASPKSKCGNSVTANVVNSSECFNVPTSSNLKPFEEKSSPGSVDDSEDSISSGIGEMTTASTGDSEKRTSSAGTLTESAERRHNYIADNESSQFLKTISST